MLIRMTAASAYSGSEEIMRCQCVKQFQEESEWCTKIVGGRLFLELGHIGQVLGASNRFLVCD